MIDLSGQNTVTSAASRKFVDTLPGLGAGSGNNLGQYIPVAVADTTHLSAGSDYYEIALVEYTEQMHSDLPPTKLRGYVQNRVNGANGYFPRLPRARHRRPEGPPGAHQVL